MNEVKRALQAEIRHYDKEFSLFRHYKQNSCPSASPTGRRNSFAPEEKRLKFWKPKEKNKSKELEKFGDKQNSLSEEDITTEPKSDLMFSSLDESKLGRMECESPTPGFQRRTWVPWRIYQITETNLKILSAPPQPFDILKRPSPNDLWWLQI